MCYRVCVQGKSINASIFVKIELSSCPHLYTCTLNCQPSIILLTLGERGVVGIPGLPGDQGEMGDQGAQGIQGGVGDAGEKGPVGPRGKSLLQQGKRVADIHVCLFLTHC